ncbi:MAG: hypothetical protein AAF447_04895 [Myxococcota bacterium]
MAWGCGAGAGDESPPAETGADDRQVEPGSPAGEAPPHPSEALAALDPRRPVPLQPMMAWHQKQNMMAHLVAVQAITEAAARGDWGAVAQASRPLESSPRMATMCEHMGAGADGFTEAALAFHARADAIGEAAKVADGPGVLEALAATLEACTSCHAAYRQEVVHAAEWEALTKVSHHPSPHPSPPPSPHHLPHPLPHGER